MRQEEPESNEDLDYLGYGVGRWAWRCKRPRYI